MYAGKAETLLSSETFGWYDLLQGNFFWCKEVHNYILFTSLLSSLPLEHYKSKKAVSMNFKDRKDQYLPASPKLSFARIFTGDARAQNALCSSGDANLSFVCLFLLKDTGFEQH